MQISEVNRVSINSGENYKLIPYRIPKFQRFSPKLMLTYTSDI